MVIVSIICKFGMYSNMNMKIYSWCLAKKSCNAKISLNNLLKQKKWKLPEQLPYQTNLQKKKIKIKKKKHNTVQERNTIHFLEKSWTPTITITHYTITLEYFFFQIKKHLFMNSKTMRMKLRSYKMWGMSNRSIFVMP